MTRHPTDDERRAVQAAFEQEARSKPWAKRDARRKSGAARKKAIAERLAEGATYRQALASALGKKLTDREVR